MKSMPVAAISICYICAVAVALLGYASSAASQEFICRISSAGNSILVGGSATDIGESESITVAKARGVISRAERKLQRKQQKTAGLLAAVKTLPPSRAKKTALTNLKRTLSSLKRQLKKLKIKKKALSLCGNASLTDLPEGVSSRVELSSLTVAAGEAVKVPGTLAIISDGAVEIAGALEAAGDNGQSISIISSANITVGGVVTAGKGEAGNDKQSKGLTVTSGAGADGGGVTLTAPLIQIASGAQLTSGSAGSGEDVSATFITPPNQAVRAATKGVLKVNAGAGGKGGDIILNAGEGTIQITPNQDGTPLFVLGDGGKGGDAKATAQGASPQVRGLNAQGGKGGDSGMPTFIASAVMGLTGSMETVLQDIIQPGSHTYRQGAQILVLNELSSKIFSGGRGGDAGASDNGVFEDADDGFEIDAAEDDDKSCAKKGGTPGRACTPAKGNPGGNGFFCPGDGSAVRCRDPRRNATGDQSGGDATVEGGDGGNLRVLLPLSTTVINPEAEVGLGIMVSAIPTGDGRCGKGGNGGPASAIAGNGGPVGGSGGKATATGGAGGYAPHGASGPDVSLTLNAGGGGGDAVARGGDAAAGTDCCNPPKDGQAGGTGGDALAKGGKGGEGVTQNYGGSAVARSGDAGDGGDGAEPAFPGQVGQVSADIGAQGDGTFGPAPNTTIFRVPQEREEEGAAASPGQQCGGVAPTPTPPSTSPGSCGTGSYSGNAGCGFGRLDISETTATGQPKIIELGLPGSDSRVGARCERTAQCPCLITGITIFNVEDHTCCLSCENGQVKMECTNPMDGVCNETFIP